MTTYPGSRVTHSNHHDKLLRTAEEVARERPEVDLDTAREVFLEAATLLHNGLVLDGLDEHDAIRDRSRRVLEEPGDLHDPGSVSRALLIVTALFQL